MLPVSNRAERVATLIAIAVGWLLVLAYLLMLLVNLISALQEGASGNLLARVFSFAGLGIDQPWLEAYALANVAAVVVLLSLATRALLRDALAAKPDPLTLASPAPATHTETGTEHLNLPFSLAESLPVDRLIGHDSELEQDARPEIRPTQDDESAQMEMQNNFVTEPEAAQRLLVALAAFSSADVGRNATLALGAAILQDEATARVAVRTLVEEGFLDTFHNGAIPLDGDCDRVLLHALFVDFSHQRFATWPSDEQRTAYETVANWYATYANEHRGDVGALSQDEANIVGALEWIHEHAAGDRDSDDTIADLSNGMARFWRDTGHVHEGFTYLPWGIIAAEQVAAASCKPEDLQRGIGLADMYGEMLAREEKRADVTTPYRRKPSLRSDIGDRKSLGDALSSLGQIALRSGWLAEAERCFQQSLAITRQVQDRDGEGAVLFFLGRVTLEQERLAEAEQYFQESLSITREMQDQQGEGTILFLLGQILRLQGHYLAAADLFEEALALLRIVDDKSNYADGAIQFGRLLIEELHQRERGCALFTEAIQIRRDLGLPGEEEARATAQRLGCAV
jgi:tetratricopeptide (TPR) repeat protein